VIGLFLACGKASNVLVAAQSSAVNAWGTWSASWAWGFALIAFTITVHAVGVVAIAEGVQKSGMIKQLARSALFRDALRAIVTILVVALLLAALHGIECVLWAAAYLRLGAISAPADAVLYSVDSMTTRGSYTLALDRPWLMLGALESANGWLLFGISTAFLFAVIMEIWTMLKRYADL
jgi:hypothetical protein